MRVTNGLVLFSPTRIRFTPFRFTAMRRCLALAVVLGRSTTKRSGLVATVTAGLTGAVRATSILTLPARRVTRRLRISAALVPAVCARHADVNSSRILSSTMAFTESSPPPADDVPRSIPSVALESFGLDTSSPKSRVRHGCDHPTVHAVALQALHRVPQRLMVGGGRLLVDAQMAAVTSCR